VTNKDRILAVVRGKPVDRVPFVMYEGILPVADVIEHLGPGTIGIMKWSNVHRTEYPNCRTEIKEYLSDGRRQQKKTIHTPAGSMFEERAFEPAYGSSSIIKHFVEEEKDYEVLWSYLQDAVISPDYERFHADQSALGENGVPLVAVERTPYQQLWVQWTGLDNLGYHFADFPDKVEHTVSMLTDRAHRIFDIVRDSRYRLSIFRTILPPRPSARSVSKNTVCPSIANWPACSRKAGVRYLYIWMGISKLSGGVFLLRELEDWIPLVPLLIMTPLLPTLYAFGRKCGCL
jgi:hypothetical protein